MFKAITQIPRCWRTRVVEVLVVVRGQLVVLFLFARVVELGLLVHIRGIVLALDVPFVGRRYGRRAEPSCFGPG